MQRMIRRIGQHAVIYCSVRQNALDEALLQQIGDHRFDTDTLTQEFTFSSERGQVSAKAELIMSIAARPASMLWAWSTHLQGVGGNNAATAHIRSIGEQQGLEALTTEEIPYLYNPQDDQEDVIVALAHDVGMLAVELCGPDALYYIVPTGGGSRIVLLLTDLSIPLPPVSMDDALIQLPQLVSVGLVDDLEWSLHGLARLSGWGFSATDAEAGQRQFVLTDQSGSTRTVTGTFDQSGRLTNLNASIGGS